METIFGLEQELWELITAASLGFMLLLIIILWVKLARMNKRYKKMLNGGQENLENVMLQLQESVNLTSEQQKVLSEEVQRIERETGRLKGNIEIIRYNAFPGQGSDMSFSIAFLDNAKNGLVLTGLNSRQETYMYAKPIQNGSSPYNLSPEEKQVMDLVMEKREK